ncbi:hypothetical protein POJ06DRAFT_269575 [Lipomyces tetrasporus]|uniref:Uncharacterized protein n=1 Tax=Lipomyces tetrasporus TaxID=54092 RepID=A0AAD7QRA4_9ASCO|nr:uncharacterized protein POJ06DRAFT_269575 [Lipomyces tetrasporus]KAJ8099516.1 hypothetical protein POJ06DRAFT_269575 [Lipomyces tetrasporus]
MSPSIKELEAFNFTKTEVSTGSFFDEDRRQQDQEHGQSQSTQEEILNDGETDNANGENAMIFEESEEATDDNALEAPVNIVALLERIEVRLQGRKKMQTRLYNSWSQSITSWPSSQEKER